MIDADTLNRAVAALNRAAPQAEQIVLFGSYARGDAHPDSDLDFLVIEPVVENRAREMVRLRRALRPLRIPADVLVYSHDEVQLWGQQPGTALYWALKEGRVMHRG
jgi:predicted nucleotidyltransferase